jgi:hypothetical protein
MAADRIDMVGLLESLAIKRPVFCSERDFQFHLAWEMKERGYDVRLEYDPLCFATNTAVDLFVLEPDTIAVELKFKTDTLRCTADGRPMHLKAHPNDSGRYDFLKDIARLEAVVSSGRARRGFAVFLTNSRHYWQAQAGKTTFEELRLHEGRVLTGRMGWTGSPSPGNIKGRETPISLSSSYELRWRDYSRISAERNGELRYLLLEINP